MDVAAFSGGNFDAKEWINATFRHPDASEPSKESHASSLVMKFQLLIAKLNSNLESELSQQQLFASKLLRDTDGLQHDTEQLQCRMSDLKRELELTNSNTASSIRTLVEMDRFKSRVSATRSALREADNWTTLTAEIEDDLDDGSGGSLDAVAAKLTAIQSSLKILTHVPDYQERVLLVEGLKNRLEALSSPGLVAAFNSDDLAAARRFGKLFEGMDRASQFRKYYRKCARARILKIWADAEEVEEANRPDTARLFGAVTRFAAEQADWFAEVFEGESVSDNLIDILLEAYTSMEPKLEACVDPGLGLEHLIECKSTFNDHLKDLDDLLCRKGGNAVRSSGKMRELSKVVYRPFVATVGGGVYVSMEKERLEREVRSEQPSKDIVDELRNVAASVPRFGSLLAEASGRCLALTEGCAYPSLVSGAFEAACRAYLDRFTSLMRRLDKRKAASHSWLILQQALSLNQATGDLLIHLEELDVTLGAEFLDRTRRFLASSEGGAIHQHDLHLLDDGSSRKRLREFHQEANDGTGRPVAGRLLKLVRSACEEIQSSTFSVVFHPLDDQLRTVNDEATTSGVWRSPWAGSDSRQEDMPLYGFVPQEYITRAGQYLMTLPQHLEPYMSHDGGGSPSLARALQERVFPHCVGVSATGRGDRDHQDTPADFLLSCVARAACQAYLDAILKIPELTPNATKQLCVDIGYLGDILEDLGHPLAEGLASVVFLLRLAPHDYWSSSTEHPQKLVSAVRKMRSLNVAS